MCRREGFLTSVLRDEVGEGWHLRGAGTPAALARIEV